MKRRISVPVLSVSVLLVLGILPWAGLHAQSQTAQTTFRVTAKVMAVCEVTANDLAFGTYNPKASSPHQVTTQLRATCTPGSTYQVGLNEGTSPGATVNQRKMVSGANNLNYQLYSDSARSAIWGNTQGTDTVTGVGTGLVQDHTVFGSVLPAQAIPAGDYSDTITVRVYF
jgi:spore coat protein U-like protein